MSPARTDSSRIQPWTANPMYWQMDGQPVLLLGGSSEDNLFQVPEVEAELDRIAAAGGNYVRCTLSSRDEGDVWPFERDAEGTYDLTRPGGAYWDRLGQFLEMTARRRIVVQFELWDRFDFARDPWQHNPYNPANNVNYTAEQSGLAETYSQHPAKRENPFFRTVPALDNDERLLEFQHAQVDRLLELSLPHGHCLYCMDNETNESPEWGSYWSDYLKVRASARGLSVFTTEMWDAHDITDPMHEATWQQPGVYDFCDISQNNHSPADRHWRNLVWFREQILASGHHRPINTVKIYGANAGPYGTNRDAQERFWRNIFGGCAGTRFHRPPTGLGSGELALTHIRSMRMLLGDFDVFAASPARDLLGHCAWNEAYAMTVPGKQTAVFFPDGGEVLLDVSAMDADRVGVRWLDILACEWAGDQTVNVESNGRARLITPRQDGYWACTVQP